MPGPRSSTDVITLVLSSQTKLLRPLTGAAQGNASSTIERTCYGQLGGFAQVRRIGSHLERRSLC